MLLKVIKLENQQNNEPIIENQQSDSVIKKIDIYSENTKEEIDNLNQNYILLKAAQNFFKEKQGDEQKPVKDSIRIFNNFRIRSNSPQNQNQSQNKDGGINLGQSMNKYEDKKSEKIYKQQQSQASKVLANSQVKKIGSITDNSTLAQVQQNTSQKYTEEVESKIIGKSQSPTQKLQQYMLMRDQAELRMTNKQMKQANNLVSQNVYRKNKSEWILQQLSRFSPQQVLNLEDPVILEAIKNLDLRVEDMKNWIQVSDFYNIQESTKMQMRRYLTALNEWFYKIESIIQERDRIIFEQKKQKNKASAQNKIEKFYQNFTHSKYYREFDIEKGGGSSRGRVKKIQQSDANKSDYINSIVMNSDGSHFIEDLKLQSSHPQFDNSQNMDSSKKLKNSDPNFKNIKSPGQSYSPQKQVLNNESNITKQLKQQQEANQTSRNSLFTPNILNQSKDASQINKENGGNLDEKIVELDGSMYEKSEIIQSNKEQVNSNQVKPLFNQIQKSRYNKDDFQKKIKKKLIVEERLTNLRIHEALKYEEEQSNLQVTLKKKKILCNQRKQEDLQNKLQKIKDRNNYIDEKKNYHQLQKEEDINRRFQIIQKIQQEDEHFLNIKQKKEEIKQLMSFERDKQAQLKQQIMREQSAINADEEMKQKLEEIQRMDESIDMKNQKRESLMQAIQEKTKTQNEQKAQVLLKQYEYQKQLQEQIAGEIASKYSKSAKFLKQLQKQRSQNINEINREFEKKQKEIEERMQNIETQENQVKQEAKKLLQTRMSTSEAQRKRRLEELKQQISRTNLDKANKTMQSFYQIQKEKISKGDKYLQEEYNNRNNYQDHMIQKELYLKKCAAIRINSSFQRENIICSPKKINYIAQQIRSNQFNNIDHSF
ncbi:hypothetical protein TTHERM_00637430 (macronuclear) [Tetrahymena thermophila SB210]|uniref:Uncharacterized protein n=1 Tax=Tetrahymena thermophila (strain SB210) TaxID=312017 RepID=Q22HG0_TETTS|nr:hypothetical protein TTHERM_00637430 [Tetrahymena thermophila SB210]EAR84741.1 hypothetical protein TTHERM_00637430 [Tetrahymena thermophila SB210]|eukprot:XP_001032404.1 hypothetical protein TTHERM_00637430 [Tetrahymena thermophila SB210]